MLLNGRGSNPDTGRPWQPADVFSSIERVFPRQMSGEEIMSEFQRWAGMTGGTEASKR